MRLPFCAACTKLPVRSVVEASAPWRAPRSSHRWRPSRRSSSSASSSSGSKPTTRATIATEPIKQPSERRINFLSHRNASLAQNSPSSLPSRLERASLQAAAVEDASSSQQAASAEEEEARVQNASGWATSGGSNWLVFEHLPLKFPKNYPPPAPRIHSLELKSLAFGVNRWQVEGLYGIGFVVRKGKDIVPLYRNRAETDSLALETNKRLEYLGDGILEAITRTILYRTFPDLSNEGLVSIKNHLVSNDLLGHLFDVCKLDEQRRECAQACWEAGRQSRYADGMGDPSPTERPMPTLYKLSHSQKADHMEAFIAAAVLDNDQLTVAKWIEAILAPWLERVQLHPRLGEERFLTAAAVARKRARQAAQREHEANETFRIRSRIDRLEQNSLPRALRSLGRPLLSWLYPEVRLPSNAVNDSHTRSHATSCERGGG